jgi:ribonuclease HII|tara:strand:+ start:471 stop:1367 length:897 start_codon:yes stop_codon:yes gene_type:complete
MKIICGVDEAGRGPLAGPVVAAAVILPEEHQISGLNDSKKLTEKNRVKLYKEISDLAQISIGIVSHRIIDKNNILNATYLAMEKAILGLKTKPDLSLIDGYGLPNDNIKNEGIIRGDSKVESISAASIIAKVTRDILMQKINPIFPEFKFAKHKGYGTKYHIEILKKLKATPIHRKSFAPVKNNLPTKKVFKNKKKLTQLSIQLASLDYIRRGYEIKNIEWNSDEFGRINIIVKKNNHFKIVDIRVKNGFPSSDELREVLSSSKKTILEQNLDENILIDVANFSLKKPSIDIYSDINK